MLISHKSQFFSFFFCFCVFISCSTVEAQKVLPNAVNKLPMRVTVSSTGETKKETVTRQTSRPVYRAGIRIPDAYEVDTFEEITHNKYINPYEGQFPQFIRIKYISGAVNLGKGSVKVTPGPSNVWTPSARQGELMCVWIKLNANNLIEHTSTEVVVGKEGIVENYNFSSGGNSRYILGLYVKDYDYNDNTGSYLVEISAATQSDYNYMKATEKIGELNMNTGEIEIREKNPIKKDSISWDSVSSTKSGSNEFQVKVALKSNYQVKKGDNIKIQADGKIKVGDFLGYSTPDGINASSSYNIVKKFLHGALLVRVGSDADTEGWMSCGKQCTFTAQKDGELQFLVNDNDYKNNVGSYRVTIGNQNSSNTSNESQTTTNASNNSSKANEEDNSKKTKKNSKVKEKIKEEGKKFLDILKKPN